MYENSLGRGTFAMGVSDHRFIPDFKNLREDSIKLWAAEKLNII